ncbi:glycosyltransferase family 8 protein [Pontibacter roseus]|uniref:glycosyltransferase family 8 protein n=1 Tax=Pontibacter roseus TaxID=336989 RepID=UPI000363CADD|nr:glycosyltransferase [Pontibacter roseus]
MNIAFCINCLGMLGLGGTLSSPIRNCSNQSQLKMWFLCADMGDGEKSQIALLLRAEGYTGEHTFIDFNQKHHFGSFPSLHGDWTAYGRLLLGDLVPEDQILYLDSDLLVEVDVLEIANFDFTGHVLAAVGGGTFEYSLGQDFYINTIGIPPTAAYFNSGVLLLNLAVWRQQGTRDLCFDLAKQYLTVLPSHDESLLNMVCAGNFAKLPASFNCQWEAAHPKPRVAEKMILHFIGSPKPWDPFGSYLHNGYRLWHQYAERNWSGLFDKLTRAQLIRMWHIRRSYARCVLQKMKS